MVYSLDKKGNEIVPIWSSHIKSIAIRAKEGHLLKQTFEPNYESFNEAQVLAENNARFFYEAIAKDWWGVRSEERTIKVAGGEHRELAYDFTL